MIRHAVAAVLAVASLSLAACTTARADHTLAAKCPLHIDMTGRLTDLDAIAGRYGARRTVLGPEASALYIAAYNAMVPVSDDIATTIAWYERAGSATVYLVAIVDDVVCWEGQTGRRYHDAALAASVLAGEDS